MESDPHGLVGQPLVVERVTNWTGYLIIASVAGVGRSRVLVQCVRCEALVGTNGALDGDVVEEDIAGHGAGEA